LINPFDLFYICAYLGSSASNSPHQTGADAAAEHRESLLVGALIVHAVNDLVPYPKENEKEPFMYWDAEDGVTAASALIKRYVFVVVSFVIFILHEKNPLSRANKNIPLNKCRCCGFFLGPVTNKTYSMI
jgi:hypothetical protein